jgi:hypothetical protein
MICGKPVYVTFDITCPERMGGPYPFAFFKDIENIELSANK